VLCAGFFVNDETTNINSADINTIGTTGMNPKTAVPPGVRDNTSVPPSDQKTRFGFAPGEGAGAGIIS
jgi:hypothetical protein